MPDPIEVLKALDVFVSQFGADVDHYVDFAHLMDSESLVEYVRPVIEDRISSAYLPGFTFEDNHHAAWFMAHRTTWATWFTDYRVPEDRWDETWLRMVLVPNKRHYVAEVAAGLQRYDHNTTRLIREYKRILESGDERRIFIAAQKFAVIRGLRGAPPGAVTGERDLMSMPSWPKRLLEHFASFGLPKYDVSIIRLVKDAAKYRRRREAGTPPNGWRIAQVTYFGEAAEKAVRGDDSRRTKKREYFERWEWCPIEGIAPPEKTEISFWEPAAPGLWDRKWKKNRRPFRD